MSVLHTSDIISQSFQGTKIAVQISAKIASGKRDIRKFIEDTFIMQITEHRDITLLRKYQTMERKNGENASNHGANAKDTSQNLDERNL